MLGASSLSKGHARLFNLTIQAMPQPLIYKIAEENDRDIPFDLTSIDEIAEYLFNELSDEAKEGIVEKYGDWKRVNLFFHLRTKSSPHRRASKKGSCDIVS